MHSQLSPLSHYHCLLLDGGYAFASDTEDPFFVERPAPTDEDVRQNAEARTFYPANVSQAPSEWEVMLLKARDLFTT